MLARGVPNAGSPNSNKLEFEHAKMAINSKGVLSDEFGTTVEFCVHGPLPGPGMLFVCSRRRRLASRNIADSDRCGYPFDRDLRRDFATELSLTAKPLSDTYHLLFSVRYRNTNCLTDG